MWGSQEQKQPRSGASAQENAAHRGFNPEDGIAGTKWAAKVAEVNSCLRSCQKRGWPGRKQFGDQLLSHPLFRSRGEGSRSPRHAPMTLLLAKLSPGISVGLRSLWPATPSLDFSAAFRSPH